MANQPITKDEELTAHAATMLQNSEWLDDNLRESIQLILSLKGDAITGDFADKITEFAELMDIYLGETYSTLAYEVHGQITRYVDEMASTDDTGG